MNRGGMTRDEFCVIKYKRHWNEFAKIERKKRVLFLKSVYQADEQIFLLCYYNQWRLTIGGLLGSFLALSGEYKDRQVYKDIKILSTEVLISTI